MKAKSAISVLALAIMMPAVPAQAAVTVAASAHVQNIGWMPPVEEPNTVGTIGRSLRMEAIRITGVDRYRAHVQNLGWQGWVESDNIAGTVGKSLRLEAIQTTGVKCRAHVQNLGWLPWVNPGETCGTVGRSLRLEAVQLQGPLPENPPTDVPEDVIVAVGDIGLEDAGLDTMKRIGDTPSDAAIILGDLGYGAEAQPFCDAWNSRVSHPLVWVQGNHETRDNDGADTADYAECLPGYGSGQEGIEQVADVGQFTRVITASPQNGVTYSPGSPGYLRIAAAIDQAHSDGKWVILAMHEAHYSIGLHGPSGPDSQALAYLAREKGVRLLLAGHDHNYSRIIADNVTHVVVGIGGHNLRDLDYAAKHWPIVKTAHSGLAGAGYVRLSVTSDKIFGELIGSNGDTFVITK